MIHGRFPALTIHHQKDDRLFLKDDRVFKKDDRVFKKRGHLSNPTSECRKTQPVQDDYTPQTPTSQSINQRVYKMQEFSANSLKKNKKTFGLYYKLNYICKQESGKKR